MSQKPCRKASIWGRMAPAMRWRATRSTYSRLLSLVTRSAAPPGFSSTRDLLRVQGEVSHGRHLLQQGDLRHGASRP